MQAGITYPPMGNGGNRVVHQRFESYRGGYSPVFASVSRRHRATPSPVPASTVRFWLTAACDEGQQPAEWGRHIHI